MYQKNNACNHGNDPERNDHRNVFFKLFDETRLIPDLAQLCRDLAVAAWASTCIIIVAVGTHKDDNPKGPCDAIKHIQYGKQPIGCASLGADDKHQSTQYRHENVRQIVDEFLKVGVVLFRPCLMTIFKFFVLIFHETPIVRSFIILL